MSPKRFPRPWCASSLAGSVAFLGLAGNFAYAIDSYTCTNLYPLSSPSGSIAVYTVGLPMSSTGQIAGYSHPLSNQNSQAIVWQSDGTLTALGLPSNLPSSTLSVANGAGGSQQVGYAGPHAILWNAGGTAIDLNPTNLSGFNVSAAIGTNGGQQVGGGGGPAIVGHHQHALLWNGTANSAMDLNPSNLTGFTDSFGHATDGTDQVGWGSGTNFGEHALLWHGSASTAVDLNPTNIATTDALGVGGNQQVGTASANGTGSDLHAMLWTGSAITAKDLNPTQLPGFVNSTAFSTNGYQQVGYGFTSLDSFNHALVWSGTADSAVDLNPFLPANLSGAIAYNNDPSGNVFGIASNSAGSYFAVEWSISTLTPEPVSGLLLATSAAGLILRRRLRRTRVY
jgi:hypothetical protein